VDIAETLQKQVDDTVQKGAIVLVEGGRSDKGSSFAPMVLGNVKPGMPAYHEELFGPVAILFRFTTIEDALRLANDTVYGLCASVWTVNKKLAAEISSKLNVGYVAINNMVVSDPRLPFGGVKRSGFGRELGDEGLLEFVNLKTVFGA
ncbi:MAG: aldehyde dehydrogenase family protein, partial [Saprospiraceae bacterium]